MSFGLKLLERDPNAVSTNHSTATQRMHDSLIGIGDGHRQLIVALPLELISFAVVDGEHS